MAEEDEEVKYSSVVFKSNKVSPSEAKTKEETVYDEVKVKNETAEQPADTNTQHSVSAGFLAEKKANSRRQLYQWLACSLGFLCVILLLAVIGVGVYLATLSPESELNELRENQTTLLAVNVNLTNLNDKLSSDNENFRRDRNNLTVQLGNLTQNYTVLESKIANLTAENQQLNSQNQQLNSRNQELETQRDNLTEQIRDMKTKANISQAQWSIDAYCPRVNNNRQCKPCQKGWEHAATSCYAYNNPQPSGQKTWEEAREDCRGKNSDLTVVHTDAEKNAVNANSAGSTGTNGYWIGLKVEDGGWKWIDGSVVTVNYWTQPPPPPTEGQCAMSVQNVGWSSVSCDDRKQWICQQTALSV